MILQALKEYYDRKPDLPREGWERREFSYLAVIDLSGNFLGFKEMSEGVGQKKRGKEYLVPSLGEKKGNGIKANLLWENLEYLFGIPVQRENGKPPDPERVGRQHLAFEERVKLLGKKSGKVNAVLSFLNQLDKAKIQSDPLWPTVVKRNQPMLIAIDGVPVTDDPEVREVISSVTKSPGKVGRCLVTGLENEIVPLEPPIKGVRGANPTGASLVSVNNKVANGINGGAVPAFSSFLKEQGNNSPIGKCASFAYSTGLNYLLRKDSKQKVQIGDATTVFWSAKESPFECAVPFFFSEPPKDDPDKDIEAVKALYDSIWNGSFAIPEDENRFFVLGLSPNSARIAVRFWTEGSVREIGSLLKRHVADLAIVPDRRRENALPLRRLLRAIASQEDEKNIPPNLVGETMRAIFSGTPYPATLLQASVRRIRAEQGKKNKKTGHSEAHITFERAALIKACLNRSLRFGNPQREKEMTMGLDVFNNNVGYRLGRLFALLEKVQGEAQGSTNSTIRDRFYGGASCSPVTVFGNLMRLRVHHLAKLSVGLRIIRERQMQEIVSGIPSIRFPAHLDLADQGRFAIGYYHQMQDLFTKRHENNGVERKTI